VSVLEAATGETIDAFAATDPTDEILLDGETLVLRVRVPGSPPEKDVWDALPGRTRARLMALDAKTGATRWRGPPAEIPPLTLAAAGGRVFYSDYERVVCLDLASGRERWRSAPLVTRVRMRGVVGTLVAHERVVLFAAFQGESKKDGGRLHALCADTGKLLWGSPRYAGPAPANPPDVFVAAGLVWIGETKLPVTHEQTELRRSGFHPFTGKVVREIVVPKLISWGHHYRCYRSKATERFLLLPKRGVEFVDLADRNHARHDWLRAPCIYGVMPANGLLYVAPHQCVCYQGVLLSNFNALAPRAAAGSIPPPPVAERLRRGPAWGRLASGARAGEGDWPAYRRDARRSGASGTDVPDGLAKRWSAAVGGRVTPPVLAGGRVLVAAIDAHTVHALDAGSGKRVWSYTAGGRVDSPPSVHGSAVLFGAADGRVYCLRLEDGAEAWRFTAAPHDRRVPAFGQVESAWPVHGSVLVQRDASLTPPREVAYFTAGRSSFLDGGIRVYALDPATGAVLHTLRLDGPHEDPYRVKGKAGYMDGAKSDILVGDGSDVYLFQERFGSDLRRHPSPLQHTHHDRGGFRAYPAAEARGSTGARLMTTHGFLVDTDNEGKYWTYGRRWPGWDRRMTRVRGAYGQLLVFDEKTLYGVHVFTRSIRVRRGQKLSGRGPRLFARDHGAKKNRWSFPTRVRVRALTLAAGTLLAAGPPNAVPPDDPLAAIEGRRGGRLLVISTADGKVRARHTLEAPPVFDGMIAAGSKVYVTTTDGKLTCLGGGR
jgi:outer membrane protein assembly factor BamB